MDSGSECSILDLVEDNEGIVNVDKYFEGTDDSKVCDNGFCSVGNSDSDESLSEIKGGESEQSRSLSHMELQSDESPSLLAASKGYGLKKWRRIRRDSNKVGDDGADSDNIVIQEVLNLGANSGKRLQVYSEGKKKRETSVASMNTMVRSLEGFDLLGDSGLVKAPTFAAGTDLENGEDRSSKSSTPVKAHKIRGETSVAVGFPHDKSRTRSLSGKNLMHPVLRDQLGNGSVAASKKSRGDKVKIEKENFHSSLESDIQSSNFMFMQGSYSTSNGIHDYDEDNGDEVEGTEQHGSNRLQGCYKIDDEAECEDFPPEHAGADPSCEVKDDRNQSNGSSADLDPLVESMVTLQTVKETLENEVLKLREICKDFSVDLAQDLQCEVLETEKRDFLTDIEELFKQRIEADVVHLAISRTVQNLKAAAVDQISIFKEQKALASKQSQLLHKFGGTEKKALMLNKEAEKLETFCNDIMRADERLKIQKMIRKYTLCFFLQLVALMLVLAVFIFKLSPKYVDVAPT